MIQFVLRGIFVVTAAAVGALYAAQTFTTSLWGFTITIVAAIAASLTIIIADILTPKKRLSAISGLFLGLIVGMLATFALSYLVDYVHYVALDLVDSPQQSQALSTLFQGLKVLIGVVCVFVCTSLILQTKDDFRFVIPYVEFTKQIRGTRPMLLDTSAIIDGRILDIAQTQIMAGLIVVPRFVLNELQTIADSADKLKRARGRRGLDILTKLQASPIVDVSIEDADAEGATVDQKLVSLAQDLHARLMTTDFNLSKIAQVRGVDVININSLAEALRPAVLPGEKMNVLIVKPGESPGQGVGYLDDGTMVVVEQSRERIGHKITLTVTSVLQTAAGRMIFGRPAEDQDSPESPTPPARPRPQQGTPTSR